MSWHALARSDPMDSEETRPRTPAGERWFGSVTWMDSGGGEHTLQHWTLEGPTVLLSAMASMFDVLTELAILLEDAENPQTTGLHTLDTEQRHFHVTRHLYRVRVTWWEGSGMEHTEQGWEATGADAWAAISTSVGRLQDLREVLRQVYGPRSPRLIGEEEDSELEATGDPDTWSGDLTQEVAQARHEVTRRSAGQGHEHSAHALSQADQEAHMATRIPRVAVRRWLQAHGQADRPVESRDPDWAEQLAAYDERDVSRARRVEDLGEALKRLAPEHE